MSRLLITGATGLVGSAILQRVTEAGHSVVALSRTLRPADSRVQWIAADLQEDIRPVLMKISPVDAVIHNAASLVLGNTEAERAELSRVNRRASQALIEWSVQHGVRTFIFSSSLSLVARPLPRIITEDVPVLPTMEYSRTKYEVEQQLEECARDAGMRSFIFRISSPVSSNPDYLPRNVIRLWIDKATKEEDLTVFGTGGRTQDFVSVDDIASAYEIALQSDAAGLYNLASGTSMSMRELAEMVANHFDVGVNFQGHDGQESERWNISIEKARRHLGYAPVWTSRSIVTKLLNHLHPCELPS